MTEENKNIKKKNSGLNWILWWKLDEEEIKTQVDEYNTLKITKSARGVSTLLLLLSAGVTTLFVIFKAADVSAFVDVALFIFLAFFTYKGKKWSFIAAMLLWTFEKVFMFAANPIMSILWWTIYMHAFYQAYKVESIRAKTNIIQK